MDESNPTPKVATTAVLPPTGETGITRLEQTGLIIAVIAVFGLAILYAVTRLPDGHPYKSCQSAFGIDSACAAAIAGERLSRGIVY